MNTSISVLLVDDSLDILELLSRSLESAGFSVKCASNAMEAATLLQAKSTFDVVVTDLQMPGKSGIDLFLESRPHALPFILMTGNTNLERKELLALGMAEILFKPFHNEALRAAILNAVSGHFRGISEKVS